MAKKETLKVKFKQDYTPRKKGEVVELDKKLAEYYINVGVAQECVCKDTSKPCKECEEASDKKQFDRKERDKQKLSSAQAFVEQAKKEAKEKADKAKSQEELAKKIAEGKGGEGKTAAKPAAKDKGKGKDKGGIQVNTGANESNTPTEEEQLKANFDALVKEGDDCVEATPEMALELYKKAFELMEDEAVLEKITTLETKLANL